MLSGHVYSCSCCVYFCVVLRSSAIKFEKVLKDVMGGEKTWDIVYFVSNVLNSFSNMCCTLGNILTRI